MGDPLVFSLEEVTDRNADSCRQTLIEISNAKHVINQPAFVHMCSADLRFIEIEICIINGSSIKLIKGSLHHTRFECNTSHGYS